MKVGLSVSNRIYLTIGILLAVLSAIVAGNYFAVVQETDQLNQANELIVPASRASSNARAAMLTMLVNIRGYLALGNQAQTDFIGNYRAALADYNANIAELDALEGAFTNPEDKTRLENLKAVFAEWVLLPEQMFALRDDPLQNQPAIRILNEQGQPLTASVLNDITSAIEIQAAREPS